jgi:predicted aspartyl protease
MIVNFMGVPCITIKNYKYKHMKCIVIFWVAVLLAFNVSSQKNNISFALIYDLIEQENYFKAQAVFDAEKTSISSEFQLVTEVFLDNAFNRLAESNQKISQLIETEKNLPDSLMLKIYQIKVDNSIKLFNYMEAKNSLGFILENYSGYLTESQIAEFENSLKIWSALENEPAQKVFIRETNRIKMLKDKAGLDNLEVFNENDTVNFVFDTGANLSTVPASTALNLGMKIITANLQVGTITGAKVPAKLAVCPVLKLGGIEIHNAVFLVLDDNALTFPHADYRIYGVLGFPVLEALREIQITQDGWFIVPEKETQVNDPSNLAMSGLTPLIYIDGRHYTFDTGADNTLLYYSYYTDRKNEIEKNYPPTRVKFGGADGGKEFDGFVVSETFNILGKEVTLENIQLLREKVNETETVYGNIGQDLIRQFNKMTINFSHMFIKFD